MQVSNDIINRCRSAIQLSDVFSPPHVIAVRAVLQDCIAAGASWRQLYDETADVIKTQTTSRPWDMDASPIFAQIDAFVQRCVDLLDVCEAEIQFGGERRVPVFGGAKGDLIAQAIDDINTSFTTVAAELANCGYDILDVKATRWHDDFNRFKSSVKDLEELFIKATEHAVDKVTDLTDHMHLLESLQARCHKLSRCRRTSTGRATRQRAAQASC